MKRYALCDIEMITQKSSSLEEFVKRCKSLEVDIIQYRDKKGTLQQKRTNLLYLRSLWNKVLIVNDTPELVELCDGLHLGQEDLNAIDADPVQAVKKVRTLIGHKLLGLSTHNAEEIAIANTLPLDYIGLGAYRATQTKAVTNRLGDKLDVLAADSVHPVAAIGGVRFSDTFKHVTYWVVGSGIYED